MSEELKPCPFCGGDANTIGERNWWDVECVYCGVRTTNEYESEEKAIEAWNTRTKGVMCNDRQTTKRSIEGDDVRIRIRPVI